MNEQIEYTPDHWVMLKIESDNSIVYKILAGWSGGYLDGDSWQLNSGVTRVESDGDDLLFHGHSGSIYRCRKSSYGLSSITTSALRAFEKRIEKSPVTVSVLTQESNFMELNYE